jgi:hypothetical protein
LQGVEETTFDTSSCTFVGAGERAGTYDVSASRGRDILASERVTVREDGCHVEPESRTLVVD